MFLYGLQAVLCNTGNNLLVHFSSNSSYYKLPLWKKMLEGSKQISNTTNYMIYETLHSQQKERCNTLSQSVVQFPN